MSLQTALNKVFSALDAVFDVPTAGAFCHARQKLKPEVFTHLNCIVTRFFYTEADDVRRWCGHRMLSADATFLNLPDTAETRAQYSLQTSQHEGAECVQALCSVLYDVLNDLGLALALVKRQGETTLLLAELWKLTQPDDSLIVDRAYADYRLLAQAVAQGRHVIVRLPRGRFGACEAFWTSGQAE